MVDRDPLLFGIRRAREFKDHSRTLDSHVRLKLVPFIEKGIENGRTQLVLISGLPGSGKTTIEGSIRRMLGSRVIRIGFDEDGRNIAREEGIIGKARRPYETVEEYFEKMSSPLVPRMIEVIRENPDANTILVNAPTITQLKIGGEYRGVNLGSDLLNIWLDPELLARKFKIDPARMPESDLHMIVLIADRDQRIETAKYRYDIKNAETPDEIRDVAIKYGIDVANKTDEELLILRADGARVSTMDTVREKIDELVYGEHGKPLRRNLVPTWTESMLMSHLPSARFGYIPSSTRFQEQLGAGIEALTANSLRDMNAEILMGNHIRRSFGKNRKNVFIGITRRSRALSNCEKYE